MNKKIVFSLAVLSAFSYVNAEELRLDGADDCISGVKSLDNLKKCTTLRKDPKQDDFYIQCVTSEKDIAYQSEDFHLINILTQKAAANQPEKVRYEALRKCGMTYFNSRMAAAYKAQIKFSANIYEANEFVNSYKKLLDKTEGLSSECKALYKAEKNYISNSAISMDNLDLDPYYAVLKERAPVVIDLKNGSNEFKKTIRLKSDTRGENNDRKVVQEFYQEFKTHSTGRVMVSSSKSTAQEPYIVYLLDQQEPKAYVGDGWYPDIFRHFTNIVGDATLSNNALVKGKGCNDLVYNKINTYESPRLEDSNKLIYVDERYYALSMQGVCDAFRGVFEKGKIGSYDFERAKEMYFLKNSKVKPFNYNDYFADYNDNQNENRTNDYRGGISKCYNYDLENFTSKYSRVKYFDWLNERSFTKDPASRKYWYRQHNVFSIHKNNGNHKGVFTDDTGTELQEYKFSVNARPSFKADRHGIHTGNREDEPTLISELEVKFVPDANYFKITDKANQDNITKALKVTNLDDVYISLNNSKMPFTAADRMPDGGDLGTKISYYLSKFKLTTQKLSDANGAVTEGEIEIKTDGKKLPLYVVDGISGFGLKLGKDTLKNLVKIAEKDLEDGNRYEITFIPTEIVEEITEKYEEEVCPTSGSCDIVIKERKYTRPMYQETGEDIIKGSSDGNVKIILGNMSMPKDLSFGTAYTGDNTKVVDDKGSVSKKVKVANKFYTRTDTQDIFAGFILPDRYNIKDRYIKFFDRDGNDVEAEIFVNGLVQHKTPISEKTCKNYYKLNKEMIIKFKKKLPVDQNYLYGFTIAEYDKIFDECVELGTAKGNEFSIRPEEIKYSIAGKNSFEKNVGKVDSNFADNNVNFTSSIKDDRFGIGLAELRVEDKDNNVKTFHLENENAMQLSDLNATNVAFADFKNSSFNIKTVFPLGTDAKIAFAESKFTINDLKNELCSNTNTVLDTKAANEIGIDGKINCQTPGNTIDVNFVTEKSLNDYQVGIKEKKISLTNDNFVNFLPFSNTNANSLLIPMQFVGLNNDKYFYQKLDKDSYTITIRSNKANDAFVNIIEQKDFDIKQNKNTFEVSGVNDKYYDMLNSMDEATKLSEYDDIAFDASEYGKIDFYYYIPKNNKVGFYKDLEFRVTNDFDNKNVNTFKFDAGNIELRFGDIKGKRNSTTALDDTNNVNIVLAYNNKNANKYLKDEVAYLKHVLANAGFYATYKDAKISKNSYELLNSLKSEYVKDKIRFELNGDLDYLKGIEQSFTIELSK